MRPLAPLPPMGRARTSGEAPHPDLGRWLEQPGPTQWAGICCRCETLTPAVELHWRIGPFNRWEGWVCKTCDKMPRQPWPRAVTKRNKRG